MLRFTSLVHGFQVEGLNLIRWDDESQIASFTVMIRPFNAQQTVMTQMLKELTTATD